MIEPGSLRPLEILVTVKAYPTLSDRHGESVCVAGVLLNSERPAWVRLFPVPFRRLPMSQQFKKYDVIRLDAWRTSEDARPESWLPNAETISIVRNISSAKGWRERKELILPLLAPSMCAIQRAQAENETSLGVFRPAEVLGMTHEDAKPRAAHKEAIANQGDLFEPSREALEELPYKFRYRFTCREEKSCQGHRMSILDWEIGQAFRSWRDLYGEDEVIDRIKSRWLKDIASDDRDLILYAGNIARYPKSFCILGAFWPPRVGYFQPRLL